MPNVKVSSLNSTGNISLCKPAMGYSFAAGTTDGPGMFDFKQGKTSTNIFWNTVRNLLQNPTAAQVACHHPKPILLDTGETLKAGGFPADTLSVIAGLSNDYGDYVATYEEYQIQRYEGASTIFGPRTLDGYIQNFKILAENMATGVPSEPGPNPPNLLSKQLSFLPPVIFDRPPLGKHFGDVLVDCQKTYFQNSSVNVTFVSANPRNSIGQTSKTFLTVEMLKNEGRWEVMATNANWETKFEWRITSMLLGESSATITWDIPSYMAPGTYVIKIFGYSKSLFGKSLSGTITPFSGRSSTFNVLASRA
ncbi:neutral ceramidase 2-like [Gigantopelta aegis]|uniref:neutral ceramidase 2-like n=1 Tax=Gigantopelta aegis TaxID=1735272 RepID=UPI001B888929|nr:neutral ceramidase 2-like [Gigantopelta aegis]